MRLCAASTNAVVFVEKNKGEREFSRQSEHEVHAGELFNSPITRKAWPIETGIRRVSNHGFLFSRSFLLARPSRGRRRAGGEKDFTSALASLGSFFVPISFVYELNSMQEEEEEEEEQDDITPEQTMLRRTRSALVRKNRGRGWQSRSIGIRFRDVPGRSLWDASTQRAKSYLRYALVERRGRRGRGRINPSRFTSVILRPPTSYETCFSPRILFLRSRNPFLFLPLYIYVYVCVCVRACVYIYIYKICICT